MKSLVVTIIEKPRSEIVSPAIAAPTLQYDIYRNTSSAILRRNDWEKERQTADNLLACEISQFVGRVVFDTHTQLNNYNVEIF